MVVNAIRSRVTGTLLFTEIRSEVVKRATAAVLSAITGKTEEQAYRALRKLGGFSLVCENALSEVCQENPKTIENLGTEMWPMSVFDCVREILPFLREEVQAAVAQRR